MTYRYDSVVSQARRLLDGIGYQGDRDKELASLVPELLEEIERIFNLYEIEKYAVRCYLDEDEIYRLEKRIKVLEEEIQDLEWELGR